MPVVENSIVINAPVKKVFGLLDDAQRFREYFAGVVRVSKVNNAEERIGDSANITYSVLGVHFDLKSTIPEVREKQVGGGPARGRIPRYAFD